MPVLRTTCINMVLGTDMKKHFDIMSRFQVLLPICLSCFHPANQLVFNRLAERSRVPATATCSFVPDNTPSCLLIVRSDFIRLTGELS